MPIKFPRTSEGFVRPVLKWAGGKARLLPEILKRLPDEISTYYEPFVGSGAVFFALAGTKRFKSAVLSDQNAELINVYSALKKDCDQVIRLLHAHRDDHSRDFFYELRERSPGELDPFARAARTIYLNKTGFNGLYRVNRSGGFNVPFGRYTKPNICDEPRLRAAAAALRGVKLQVKDFEEACEGSQRGDAVYFDPPYVPLSRTSNFTAYHSEAFDEAAHERLARVFGRLAKRSVRVVLSNSDTPVTRALYEKWRIDSISVSRPINSKTDQRGNVGEILVCSAK